MTIRLDKALQWYNKSLEVTEAVFGQAHPNMAIVWTHIAVLLKKQGKLKDAIHLYERILKLRREACSTSVAGCTTSRSLVAQVALLFVKLILIYDIY